jgi:centromeric protein E
LLTLGTVIARLSDSKDKNGTSTDKEGKHLPYRDSKLTRLLQPALSGNSLVSILCTIQIGSSGSAAPANSHTGETLNTLKFAARAKNNIVSHAKKAEEAYGSGNGDAGSRVLLERYRMEIQGLRTQLENQSKTQAENEVQMEEKQFEKEAETRHEEQMLEIQLARTALKERIEHLNRLILSSKSTGVNSGNGLAAIGRQSRQSGAGTRSLRSSASQSTLGAHSLSRTISQISINSVEPSYQNTSFGPYDDDDTMGEFGDGNASVQMQVFSLQADLADKNRYISTLERRLLQARRSSHSRMSMGLSQLKSGDESDAVALLREKDTEISELRNQLDDKDRMLAALRSAARQRDLAQMTGDSQQEKRVESKYQSTEDVSSSNSELGVQSTAIIPELSSANVNPDKEEQKTRKSADEMSRMLDEMILDRVENGHVIKGTRGSIRLANGKQRESAALASIPALSGALMAERPATADPLLRTYP